MTKRCPTQRGQI